MNKTFQECLEDYKRAGFKEKEIRLNEAKVAAVTFDDRLELFKVQMEETYDRYPHEEDDDLLAQDCDRLRHLYLPLVLELAITKKQYEEVLRYTMERNVALRQQILAKIATFTR